MNREVLDNWCERGILGLVLVILVFGPLATGAVRTPDFLVLQALTVLVGLLWCVRLWLVNRPKILWPPICWAVLAFAAYAIGRYATADIEYVARQEMIRVLLYTVLFFATVNNLYRQESVNVLILTLVFLGMAVAGYAIFQFATHSNRVWNFISPYGHRGTGTFISANNCAGFLEMLIPVGFAWVLVSRARPTLKVFVGYAALVILAGLISTISRGGWVSTGVVLVIFFSVLLYHRTYRLSSLLVLCVLLIGGLFLARYSHGLRSRFVEIQRNGGVGTDARFDLWMPAVAMWRENPWWGVGPAHYDYRFREWRPVTVQRQPDRAHNDYLNTLADWGVVGFSIVSSAFVLLGAGVVKTWRFVAGSGADLGGRNSNKFALLLGASLGVIAILIHSFVDFNMHIPANAILAVTLMALLSGALRFATDNYWHTARILTKLLATILLLASIGYLGWQGVRRTRENHWLNLANLADVSATNRIECLEKAFAIEPMNAATAYALGETLRLESWEGNDDYADLANRALQWLDRAQKLNRYDGYNFLRAGMCLDWIGQHEKAEPFFVHAAQLDPNGYFTTAFVGWHQVQLQDYAAAKVLFERSLNLDWESNTIAESYLNICNQKLLQASTNSSVADGLPIR